MLPSSASTLRPFAVPFQEAVTELQRAFHMDELAQRRLNNVAGFLLGLCGSFPPSRQGFGTFSFPAGVANMTRAFVRALNHHDSMR